MLPKITGVEFFQDNQHLFLNQVKLSHSEDNQSVKGGVIISLIQREIS